MNPLILKNYFGILLFTVLLFLMFLIVPWRRVKSFLGVGIFGGFGIAIVLLVIMQNVWGFWRFYQVDWFSPLRVPFFLSAAWAPLEIIFSHLLSQYKNFFMGVILTVAIPLGAITVHYFLLANKMMAYHHWNLFLTFLVSLGILLGIGYYLYITGRLDKLTFL